MIGRLAILAFGAAIAAGCAVTIELDPANGACLSAGAACTSSARCCSGACDGTCVPLAGCRPAGEPCTATTDCCSALCATGESGQLACGAIEGCRVRGELCSADAPCCDGSTCAPIDEAAGTGRCTSDASCAGAGEICRVTGSPSAMRPCCTEGGRAQCRASEVREIDRCVAPPSACVDEGAACTSSGDCCRGRCVPDGAGGLSCVDACIPGEGRCSSDLDCCSGACGSDAHCVRARACRAIAAACTADADCCSSRCDAGVCVSPLF